MIAKNTQIILKKMFTNRFARRGKEKGQIKNVYKMISLSVEGLVSMGVISIV